MDQGVGKERRKNYGEERGMQTPVAALITRRQENSRLPRPLRIAAVTLTAAPGRWLTNNEIMKEVCGIKL